MYNEEKIQKLIEKYGIEQTANYCKLHSTIEGFLSLFCDLNGLKEPAHEHSYEESWYKQKYEELLQKINSNTKSY